MSYSFLLLLPDFSTLLSDSNKMTSRSSITNKRRSRAPPSRAGVEMADATLIAIREAQHASQQTFEDSDIDGHPYNGHWMRSDCTDAGRTYTRRETENLLIRFSGRARELLMARHTSEFLKSQFGIDAMASWGNVPLREVMYALSTAHPNCLRAFRVFNGKTIEWVGDDSHRIKVESPITTPQVMGEGASGENRSGDDDCDIHTMKERDTEELDDFGLDARGRGPPRCG
jgi:hypothetical protein